MKDNIFVNGAKIHYGNSETWLALCGSTWFNVSNDPNDVTCVECLGLLEQKLECFHQIKGGKHEFPNAV